MIWIVIGILFMVVSIVAFAVGLHNAPHIDRDTERLSEPQSHVQPARLFDYERDA